MKKVCVLLNGPVSCDARVIKTVNTLSDHAVIDLFYLGATATDTTMFKHNVRLHPTKHKTGLGVRLLQHSFFYHEFAYFADVALSTGECWDIVYANDLPTLLPAVRLKQKMNARLVYDSHEIYTETLNQFFPLKPKPLHAPLFRLSLTLMRFLGWHAERRMLREVDAFITVNQSLANYFCAAYGHRPVTVVMNCPPYRNVTQPTAVNYREKYGWGNEDIIFIYQGVINRGRGYEILLQAMTKVEPKAKLVIVGDGMLRQELSQFVKSSGLGERVKFVGQVTQDELASYTLGADVGINLAGLDSFNLSKKLASPNKVFEYMHAGIPILASDTLENRRILEQYDEGILADNNMAGIVNSLNAFVHFDAEKMAYYKRNALSGAREYCWENQSQQLLKALELDGSAIE